MSHPEAPIPLLVELYAEKMSNGASDEALAQMMERIRRQLAEENYRYAQEDRESRKQVQKLFGGGR